MSIRCKRKLDQLASATKRSANRHSWSLISVLVLRVAGRIAADLCRLIVYIPRDHRAAFLTSHRGANTRRILVLEYPITIAPRWNGQRGPHPRLHRLLASRRSTYEAALRDFTSVVNGVARTRAPLAWRNPWFTGLDALSLYSMLAINSPKLYLEIGSGYSTHFARRAISDHALPTRIVAIDPTPRHAIDEVADEVICKHLEDVDLDCFTALEAGDVLFVDSSHYSFASSDSTILFTEILPILPAGVIVQLHDIFLPWDYPEAWSVRYYSEQYLLATSLLTTRNADNVLLANTFICRDPDLAGTAEALCALVLPHGVPFTGSSYWFTAR